MAIPGLSSSRRAAVVGTIEVCARISHDVCDARDALTRVLNDDLTFRRARTPLARRARGPIRACITAPQRT
jgi:hypothetical protein